MESYGHDIVGLSSFSSFHDLNDRYEKSSFEVVSNITLAQKNVISIMLNRKNVLEIFQRELWFIKGLHVCFI